MFDSWTCLMVQDGPGVIPDRVRIALKAVACRLYGTGTEETHVSTDVLQGVVKTSGKTYLVGTRSGMLFRAHIDHEGGTDYRVNFLLNQRDLENGAEILREMEEEGKFSWDRIFGKVPVPEFYQFENLAGLSRRSH